ncbi:MAG: type I pantothenate kinase [Pseudoclavibacter sp.]
MTVTGAVAIQGGTTPFVEIARSDWAELAPTASMTLDDADISRLRGLGTALNLGEVRDVYVPLSRLLNLYATNSRGLHGQVSGFLGERSVTTPFVIGIAGSVAVGKSTVSRLLRELLSRWENLPRVELVTTDGFLYPNAELERRGIMQRKGFPESYDQRALLRFITQIKSGVEEVRAPFYSHLSYDIVPDAEIVVNRPDILIVEGLNVLQPPRRGRSLAVSDMFDFSIYVDARTSDIERWYEERFLSLQRGAFTNPRSFFHRYIELDETQAREQARSIWNSINGPNLRENVLPTRSRARLVLKKDADHSVHHVLLRKI